MTIHANDVELPEDQEFLNPDATPLPAKPWTRRTVSMAITVAIVAIMGTVAILGNGANGQNARAKHYDHIQLLRRYAQMRNKKFVPLLLRNLADGNPGIDENCKQAMEKKWQEKQNKTYELLANFMEKCKTDMDSPECKKANETLHNFEEDEKSECKKNGNLCTEIYSDKNGETMREHPCLPADCHDDLEKIGNFLQEQANKEEHNIPECKDFECTVTVNCSQGVEGGEGGEEGDQQ